MRQPPTGAQGEFAATAGAFFGKAHRRGAEHGASQKQGPISCERKRL
jgi:hypothetical protein